MSEHPHVHAPPELTEVGEARDHRERTLEFAAALLLAISTLAIAWSGYQSARWSGLQSQEYARATATRAEENRLSTLAGQERLQDLLNFNRWLEATATSDRALADLYEHRFRPEFLPALNAWRAQDPLHNPAAVASPLLLPEYRLAEFEKADQLATEATRHFGAAKAATDRADRYVLITVFLAAVLFFAGISLRFRVLSMRLAVLGCGAVFLLVGIIQLAILPSR